MTGTEKKNQEVPLTNQGYLPLSGVRHRRWLIPIAIIVGWMCLFTVLCISILPRMSKEYYELSHYYMHYGEYRVIHPVWQRYGGNRFLLSCYQRLSYAEELTWDRHPLKIEAILGTKEGFWIEDKARHQLQEAGLPEAVLISFYHIPFLLHQCTLTGWGTTISTTTIKRVGQVLKGQATKRLYRYEYTPHQESYLARLGVQHVEIYIDRSKQVVDSLVILLSSGWVIESVFLDSTAPHPKQRLISVGRVTYAPGGKREVVSTRWLRADLLRMPRDQP